MAFQEKQLGQARENSTNPVSVYSPAASTTTIISSIRVCNTTASTRKVRIFMDDDGTTYDESTALYFDVPIDGNLTLSIDCFFAMNNSNGNFAYRTDLANALTITVFGAEVTSG